jgi:hypothetical protein
MDLDAARTEIQEVKRKLRKTIREKAILEAWLRGDPELPPEYDSDEPREYLLESPPRKRVHYGEPGYRTHYCESNVIWIFIMIAINCGVMTTIISSY